MPLQKVSRVDILKTSLHIFRQRGYYQTSMADLAKGVGLTKGAFYHHFKDKESVMKEALQLSASWFDRKVFSIAYEEELSDQEKLKKIAAVTYKAFTDYPGGCFFGNTILETAPVEKENPFRTEILGFFNAWEQALSHIFSKNIAPEDLKALVEQIIADIKKMSGSLNTSEQRAWLQEARRLLRTHDRQLLIEKLEPYWTPPYTILAPEPLGDLDERIPAPDAPATYTVVAADGSNIAPDPDSK